MTEQEAIKNALNGLRNADIKIDDEIRYPSIKALEKQLMKEDADGCVGCAFIDVEEWEMPCAKCKRNSKDFWRAKRGNEDD